MIIAISSLHMYGEFACVRNENLRFKFEPIDSDIVESAQWTIIMLLSFSEL